MADQKDKTQQEAIDEVLKSLYALDDLLYTEEIKKIDMERAGVLRSLYTSLAQSTKDHPQKKKAYMDVIDACMALEIDPSAQKSRELDEKLEIAEQYK